MFDIVVPEVGESVVDARVARWLKKPGDTVAAGDPLVELETDKIDLEVAAPRAGVLSRIDHEDGADVKVGEVLGVIDETGPASAAAASGNGGSAGQAPATAAAPAATRAAPEAEKTRATPAARNAAERNDVDLAQVRGSGDAGRVMRRDVEKASAGTRPSAKDTSPAAPAAEARPASPPPAPPRPRVEGDRTETRERMSKRRATIARRLVEAQSTAAMLTTFNEVDMSAVMALRERHKQAFKERHGVSLGVSSFFVKACIGALREFPRINAEIQGDEIVSKHYYDIGVAVGAAEGLVVPVLRDADRLSFAEIEQEIRRFARAAEDGSLTLADLKGGTFTITNGGVFGSLLSTPILNPPQVGILGLHAIKERPVAVGGQVVVRPMMFTALTYDHRIVDGSEAVRFLVRIKELVEDPGALLLE
ncbi:MAG TPA: 2-oxoglutarate dehydrogenase complex dihydrolipoyllysine-residue succinyltransferase [Vicinamibacterales bacterium]|jgi:2-oxoglutarate dehydrogenase E2 component (dihydrolipoamide succinyltransferase)|nr:2-oxoglutarate dehydrogenase complex dihydrolipoyllysine-residue succinyltransferase [Vicinamibacterales bacterium]